MRDAVPLSIAQSWPYDNQVTVEKRKKNAHRISGTFLCFSIVSLHHKWNGAKLLSPDVEGTSCLKSYQMS